MVKLLPKHRIDSTTPNPLFGVTWTNARRSCTDMMARAGGLMDVV